MSWKANGSLAALFDPSLADDAVREMADAAGTFATETARNLAPIGPAMDRRAPGTLKQSYTPIDVHRVEHDTGNAYASGVESDDFVARLIEYGTREHDITPRIPGGVLTFRAYPTGELVHVRRVHQRGIAGQHIVSRALTATLFAFDDIATPSVERWAERQMAAAKAAR